MTQTLIRPLETLFALSLAWLALILVSGGIQLTIGTLRIGSQKVIVPGMVAWALAMAFGALRRRFVYRTNDRASSGGEVARGGEVAGGGEVAHGGEVAGGGEVAHGDEVAGGGEVARGGGAALFVTWLGISALCLCALGRAIGRPFMLDDHMMLDTAARFEPGMLVSMLTGFGWSTPGFVRPLPELLWVLDLRLHGGDPLLCHLENLGMHLVNVLLVGLVARSLLGDTLRACFAMALFGVCATHAEPLLWISCRYDLMAASFSLLALAAFVAALDAPGDDASWPLVCVSAGALAAALLCKESALGAPLAIAALAAAHPRARSWRVRAWAAAPHLALLAVYAAYRLACVRGLERGQWATFPFQKLVQLPISPLAPLTWPVNIDQSVELHVAARVILACVLALPPLLAARSLARGIDRRVATSFALLLLLTLPVHHVISLSHTLRQSRYLYLPAAGFAVLLAALTRTLEARRAALVALLLVSAHAALLRCNAEPFAATGAVVARALADGAPVVRALSAGETVQLRGLPFSYRGVDACWGSTVIAPLAHRAGAPLDRIHLDGDAWRPSPPRFDRVLHWSPDRGFQEVPRHEDAPDLPGRRVHGPALHR